jgi:hypothetical protein
VSWSRRAGTAAQLIAVALIGGALAVPAAHASCLGQVAPDVATGAHPHSRPVARVANVSYCGGEVMHVQRTHLIFWQPSGSGLSFDHGYVQQIETFMARVAGDSHSASALFGLMGQYHDGGGPAAYNSTYAGAVLDTDPLPTDPGDACSEPPAPPLGTGPGWSACVNDTGMQFELSKVLGAHHLPIGIKDIYFLVTPAGLGSCFDGGPSDCALGGDTNNGYCGYHSSTGVPGIIYAVIPYNAVMGHCQSSNPRPNASTTDPTISTIAHEFAESATDPTGTGWSDSSAEEIADICITNYGPALGGTGLSRYDAVIGGGHYWIQELWSNFTGQCEPGGHADSLSITGPQRAKGDRRVSLGAHAYDPQGKVVAYSWSYPSGSGSQGRRTTHVFTHAGSFTVKLRITDSWGNWTRTTHAIEITAPPRPVVTFGREQSNGSSETVGFRASAAVANFQCRIDRGRWRACHSPFNARGLTAGRHAIEVRARDTFGQLSRRPARYAFTTA